MQKLEALKREPRVRGILDLTRVHGIGTEIARGLYQRGFYSVADLRVKVEAEERARGRPTSSPRRSAWACDTSKISR